MTLTILASVSLLALVSSARPLPLLKFDEDSWNGLQIAASGENGDIQQVIQAVVRSHMSPPEDLDEEDLQIQLASREEVQSYLSTADNDIAIKALVPLGPQDLHSPDEQELYELLNRMEEERAGRSASPVPDEALDTISLTSVVPSDIDSKVQAAGFSSSGTSSPHGERENMSNVNSDALNPNGLFTSMPIVVMVVSCAIALISVCCVAAALYIAEMLKSNVFRSTWGILPLLEKNLGSYVTRNKGVGGEVSHSDGKQRGIEVGVDAASVSVFESEKMPGALPTTNMEASINSVYAPNLPRIYISSTGRTLREANFDGEEEPDTGDEQDMDEKFFDAEDTSTNDSPLSSYSPDSRVSPSRSGRAGPSHSGLAVLAVATATVTAVAVAHAPEMHEVYKPDVVSVEQSPTSPATPSDAFNPSPRSSWSVRAQEAGALIRACDTIAQDDHQQRLRFSRGGGMFAAPQLDAALAMQLRPGLGIGADAAWLVRFVMALFGWCAVLMNGGRWGA